MIPHFVFLSQGPDQLVVRSPIDLFTWPPLLVAALMTLGLLFGHSQLRKVMQASDGFLIRNCLLLFLAASLAVIVGMAVWSHTVTLSRASGTLTVEDDWAGVTYHRQAVPLAQVNRAETESARGGMRIVLVLRDGETVHPFGKGFNTKANHYVVINSLNDFLSGSSAGSASTPDPAKDSAADGTDVERRVREKVREADESSRQPLKK